MVLSLEVLCLVFDDSFQVMYCMSKKWRMKIISLWTAAGIFVDSPAF